MLNEGYMGVVLKLGESGRCVFNQNLSNDTGVEVAEEKKKMVKNTGGNL